MDFTDGSVVAQVLEQHVGGVDALVNLADAVPLSAVKAGGRVSTTTGAPDPETAASAGLAWSMVIAVATSDVLARLVDLVVAGEVVVPIDAVLTSRPRRATRPSPPDRPTGKLVVSLGQGKRALARHCLQPGRGLQHLDAGHLGRTPDALAAPDSGDGIGPALQGRGHH